MKHRSRMTVVARAVAVLLLIGVAAFAFSGNPTGSLPAPERYAPEPGRGQEAESEAEEREMLLTQGDYWATRLTYPTGRFDQVWLLEAERQDRAVPRGVPAGRTIYQGRPSQSSLQLDPNQFTALGPQPLQSDGCLNCYNYGHVAGRTNVVAIDPVSPTIAYLGSDGGGVWKTTNCCSAATTWTSVTDDPLLSTIAIGDLVIDPNNHLVVYAGTGDLRYGSFSFGSAGVLKSTDQGATWSVIGLADFAPPYPGPVGQFPQYQAIGKVRVDPRNSNNLVVGAKTGVFFSYDQGDHWTGPCLTDGFTTQRHDITGLMLRDSGSATSIYAAVGTRGHNTPVQPDLNQNGANGIYSTTLPLSGCPASWNLLTRSNNGWPTGTGGGTPYPTNQLGRIDVAMSPSDPNVMYAQVANISTFGLLGVWRTIDGGVTWEQRATAADQGGCDGDGSQNWYDQGLIVDPNNPDVVFMSAIDIFKSKNGADTFTNLTCGYAGGTTVHVDQHAMAFAPGSSSVLLTGSDGGAYVSTNADADNPTFTQLNDSLNTIEFYSGDITANFATSAAPGINAGAQDNGSSVYVWSGNPGPAIWQLRKGGDGMFARIEPVLGQRWYQESQNGNLAVSTTGPYGSQINASGAWSGDRLSFVFPYEIFKYDCPPTGCTHLIAGTYRVYESINGAIGGSASSRWYVNSPDLTKNTLGARSFINQLSFSVLTHTIALVGTNDGNVQYGYGLGTGVANSATWVNVTGGNATLPNRPMLDVTTDPINPWIGYAAVGGFNQNTPTTPGHVFRVTCTVNCATFTWEDKSGNLPNIPIDSILANPRYPQQVFAGSDWGLYYTDNINANPPVWQKFTAGLPNVMIWDMAIDRGFTALALFTRARGAYAWPLPDGPVGASYSATLSGNSVRLSAPGTSVTHVFTLANTGSSDAYTLTLSGNAWTTTILITSPLSVTAGATTTIPVQVNVPALPWQTDSFTLTVQSTNDPLLILTARGDTQAIVHPALVVSSDMTRSGTAGSVLTYTVAVTNTGDYTDTFDIALGPHTWTTTSQYTTTGALAPGASFMNDVAVTIGTGPSEVITVTFTSLLSSTVQADVTLTSQRQDYQLYLPLVLR